VTLLNGGLMLPAVPFPHQGCSAGRADPACLQEYSGVLTWHGEPIPKIIDGKETYPNARRPERPTAEFIDGNPGWIRPLILQKSGGLQGSFAYLADCADPGVAAFSL
jgi:hypothetical protein